MRKFLTLSALCCALTILASCHVFGGQEDLTPLEPKYNVKAVFPMGESPIRTPDGANALDLETPLRCHVNWDTQQMLLTLPFNNAAFKLERANRNDPLPRFEVMGYTFETEPAEQALLQLTDEAGIKLVAKDAPYDQISGDNLRGEFADIVDMITQAAEIFQTYDAKNKVMTLSRKVELMLYTPPSRPILLAALDVLRGAGITDMTTNWADYTILFDADVEVQNKILKLIDYFGESPALVAYDISIFKIFPNDKCDIQWKKLLDTFEFGTITTAQTSVIGRVLTTTNDINLETLSRFVGKDGRVVPVAEGRFVVPNQWLSRFDIGKCGLMKCAEADLSVLARADVSDDNRIISEITLENTQGQITKFKTRNKLGENLLMIGLPNELFGVKAPRSETVIFMVPRLIKTLETTETIKNNI